MTDIDSNQNQRADTINSEHFRRTKAEKIRTINSGELRDVNAADLQEMYHIDTKVNQDKNH